MLERKETLEKLIKFSQPLEKTLEKLKEFEWDSSEELVILRRKDISSVLKKYLQSNLTASEIEDWSNALEGREDIGIESSHEDIIEEVLFELANPLLTNTLTRERAEKIVQKLI